MPALTILKVFNYGLVLIYGLFLSADIAGAWQNQQQKRLVFTLCPLFLLIQCPCWLLFGISTARQLYPLIVHLPLVLILHIALKKQLGVALVSVFTAYLCCQLPRWVNLTITALTDSPLAGEISYTLCIASIFFLLRRYFVRAAYDAMAYSRQSLLLFGSLPFAYYLFDYATAVYSDALYIGVQALNEFLPTALIVFYVIFLTAYHAQAQKRTQAELQRSMLEAELKQSGAEIANLRRSETQAAIYQHDMRHHLTAIEGFLAADNTKLAQEYIQKVQVDVAAITPKRFCENELVNLLCASFSGKCEQLGVRLQVEARLPKRLSISDTALCSVLSNGLENALHAASAPELSRKWIKLYCGIHRNKLLIEIKNPYAHEILMQNGIPMSSREGHGYGCHSIQSIAQHNRGLCTFESENGIFTLRVMLPVCDAASQQPEK